MHARGLELYLIENKAVGPADIDGRNRTLRKMDLLPTGGRGPHAPQITPEHASYMLLGLAGAVASDAGAAAKRYAAFVVPDKPKAGTLVEHLTELLSDPDRANQIEEVRLCRTHPWVMIVSTDGNRAIYRPANSKFMGKKEGMFGGREEYVIGGGMLHQIAIDIRFNQGWHGGV